MKGLGGEGSGGVWVQGLYGLGESQFRIVRVYKSGFRVQGTGMRD